METVVAIIRLNKSSVRDHSFSRKIESERSFFWLGELAQVEPRSAQKNLGELVSGAMRSNELLAIKALELFISKVLLVAAKVAERVVDNVHEKVVEKVVSMPKDEPRLVA